MQMGFSRNLQAALAFGVASIAIVAPAIAQEQAVQFNIPAQDLDKSLREFAAVANTDLLYSPDLVADRQARAVNGMMVPTAALQRMLQGTGLTYVQTSPNVLTLRLAQGVQPVSGQVLFTPANGATAPLTGVITDTTTGGVLPGAVVRIAGTNIRAITDERGQYNLPAVPLGNQTLIVEYLGEAPATSSVTIAAGQRNGLDVSLGATDGDIVVVGFRSALQLALNQQKNADNNSTVVSSDLLGGFPAETVSEALRRVPGVAFGRGDETGEGSRLTVRGFSSEAINVQLNGLDLQGTGFDRTIDLSGFLADNISQVTIHKSLLPSHEASGSGGLIEIETKSGLDYGDFSFNASIEGELSPSREFGEEFQANATVAKKITPDFGIAATIQYRKTDRTNYDVSIIDTVPPVLPLGFTSIGFIPASVPFPFDPEIAQQQLITTTNLLRRERDEEALVGSINFAWDVASHTRWRLDLQRNYRETVGSSSRSAVQFLTTAVDMPIPELDNEVRRRTTLSSFRSIVNFESRDESTTGDSISFRGDTTLGRWDFDYTLGYSNTERRGDNTNLNLLSSTATNLIDIINPATLVRNPDDDTARTQRIVDGAFILASNGVPVPSLTEAGRTLLADPARYALTSATTNPINATTEEYVGELQARYNTPLHWLEYVEVGSRFVGNKRTTNGNVTDLRNITEQRYLAVSGRPTTVTDFNPELLSSADLGVIGLGDFNIPLLSGAGAAEIFDLLPNFLTDDPATTFNEARFNFTDFSTLDPVTQGAGSLVPTEVTEDNLAAYFESKLVLGDFSLIAGVRYERETRNGFTISTPSVRLNLPGFASEARDTFVEAGLVRFTDTGGTNDTWTPSFLATYRPIPQVAARLGYFRSTVNPDIRNVNRNTTFSVDLRPGFGRVTILEANPDLVPSVTNNFDLDLAYYFSDTVGLLRAGAFYKKVSNNFTNVFFGAANNDAVRQRFLDEFAPLAATRPDLLDLPEGSEFFVNRPENGEGGTIWGLEFEIIRRLDFLPGFLSDFGVLANATYTSGDFPTLVQARDDEGNIVSLSLDRALRDQAEWVYNLSLDYERDGFQGRIIYTHQDATVEAFDEFNLNTVIPAYSTLDLRLSYNFEVAGALLSLFAEGDDLLRDASEADIRRTVSSEFGTGDVDFNFPSNFQFNGGRTLTLGLRARY